LAVMNLSPLDGLAFKFSLRLAQNRPGASNPVHGPLLASSPWQGSGRGVGGPLAFFGRALQVLAARAVATKPRRPAGGRRMRRPLAATFDSAGAPPRHANPP
jgi:hypothetical protein